MARPDIRTPKADKQGERFEREARALRANLRRRKEQARDLAAAEAPHRAVKGRGRKTDG
ncbi:MAG: hypothetical protein OXG16_01310 [Rhodospirillales bacterium]|nr:hypothetical protein [Rhodospirillales bacterium]MDE0712332.1 hypothetical protein [Rhodospirillales bacterium]